MKTRTGSELEGSWEGTSYNDDEVQEQKDAPELKYEDISQDVPVSEGEVVIEDGISTTEGEISIEEDDSGSSIDEKEESEKSNPFTDGLDDEPMEEDMDEPEDEDVAEEEQQVMDPPEDIQENPPEGQKAESEDMPLFEQYLKVKNSSEKKTSIDLSDSHDTLGMRLIKYRKAAKLSLDDVYAQTHIVQDYLSNLEAGNYAELTGKIYAKRHLTTLCRIYGIDANAAEELQELLSNEYDKSGCTEREVQLPIGDASGSNERHHALLRKLPGIIISFLLILVVMLILLAIVVPLLRKSGSSKTRPVDIAPLVVPKQSHPLAIPVPK